MPRRTLAEARASFEEALPRLSDYQATEARKLLEQAEAAARQRAEAFLAERAQEVRVIRDDALRELTAVRDAFEDLASEGKAGRMPAEVFNDRLQQLRNRQARAEAVLEDAEARIEHIAAIEEDPLGWADSMAQRMPALGGDVDVPW